MKRFINYIFVNFIRLGEKYIMAKWKLFGKPKEKKETIPEKPDTNQDEVNIDTQEKSEYQPVAEYKEVLYTGSTKSEIIKKDRIDTSKDQRIWRDVKSIEKNVDDIDKKKSKNYVEDLDKKVDRIIEEGIHKIPKQRKPSNVIYVVSKPQPGQKKGDWAVRSHGKIYSHHRLKKIAIKEARKIAIKKNATVMIQKTDGTFSDGFKPRTKKK